MRTRDILLPSFLTLILAFMINFMSCASQNRAGEDNFEETTEQSISDASTEQPAEEVKEGETASNTTTDESLSSLTTDGQAADPTLEALGSEQPAEEVPAGEGEMQKLDQASADPGAAAPENEPSLLDQTLDNGPTAANDVQTEPAPNLDIPPATAASAEPVTYGGVSVPKIPSKAIARKGASLNRFYFVRMGDNPRNVSELIYGDASNSSKLQVWNGGGWKPGKILYYTSPSNAEDSVMRSFYQERNVVSQDYDVRRGDWLSRIAQKTLGSSESWKEIAVVNGMQRPDDLEPGQKLAVYPRDLSPYAFKTQPAEPEKSDVVEDTQQEAPKNDFANNAPIQDTPALGNAIQPEAQPPVAEPIPAATAPMKKNNKLDVNKMIEQNLFPIVIGAGLVILLLALSAVNRRRKARAGDDFGGDEGFAAPPKLRRK